MDREKKIVAVSAKISESLFSEVVRISREEDRTISWLIGQALQMLVLQRMRKIAAVR